jgi:transcriptional regulator with XRE-family HTH domain
MHAGYHIMSWRRHRGLTQSDLADLARLSRPYVSRLEKGQTDPALSVLRRLAVALGVTIGQMIEEMPQERILSREEMDRMARGALRPGTREARALPETRILASLIRDRRRALGLRKERKKNIAASGGLASGVNASRWLRASLGEKQWDALLRRIDKLASRTPE